MKKLLFPHIILCIGLIMSLLFACTPSTIQGTFPTIPCDTSYTITSTYNKLHKRLPEVPIAVPKPHSISPVSVTYATLKNTPYGNRALQLNMFYPADTAKASLPTVLLIHGGGWSAGSPNLLNPIAQELAASGYIAACVEYRLSPEAPYPASVFDVREAIVFLRENAIQYHVDADRIALLGCSSGAQLVSLVGTTAHKTHFAQDSMPLTTPVRVKAVVNIDGILSFIHPEAADEKDAASLWLGGGRLEKPENWKEASALEYVGNDTPPFLFVNSSHPRFHAGRDDFNAKLDSLGIYHEEHTLPDSPHSFWLFEPWFTPTVGFVVDFLNKNLK